VRVKYYLSTFGAYTYIYLRSVYVSWLAHISITGRLGHNTNSDATLSTDLFLFPNRKIASIYLILVFERKQRSRLCRR